MQRFMGYTLLNPTNRRYDNYKYGLQPFAPVSITDFTSNFAVLHIYNLGFYVFILDFIDFDMYIYIYIHPPHPLY